VLTWAIDWPVIRSGASVPPLWYATLRYAIAAPCLFAVAALRGESGLTAATRPAARRVGDAQMGAYRR
jgi:hypothetical protein